MVMMVVFFIVTTWIGPMKLSFNDKNAGFHGRHAMKSAAFRLWIYRLQGRIPQSHQYPPNFEKLHPERERMLHIFNIRSIT
jgi:hypothetical protein